MWNSQGDGSEYSDAGSMGGGGDIDQLDEPHHWGNDNKRPTSTYDAIDGYEDSDEETRHSHAHDYHHDQHHQVHNLDHQNHDKFGHSSGHREPEHIMPAPVVAQPNVEPKETYNYNADIIQDQTLIQEVFSISLVFGDNITGFEMKVTQQCIVELRHRDQRSMQEVATVKGTAKPEEVNSLRSLFLSDWENLKLTMAKRGRARSDGEAIVFREGLTDKASWFFNAGDPPPHMQKIYNQLKLFFSSYN